jgi:hypothetical protein
MEDDGRNIVMISIWGTCLGMEYIIQLVVGCDIIEEGYNATNISLPLLNVPSASGTGSSLSKSKLYEPTEIYDIVKNHNVTFNNHELSISPQTFQQNSKSSQQFQVSSINYDSNNKPFVSTIEPLPI